MSKTSPLSSKGGRQNTGKYQRKKKTYQTSHESQTLCGRESFNEVLHGTVRRRLDSHR